MKSKPSQEENGFEKLSFEAKLSKLELLVKKAQIYSQIILDNMLERSLEKKKIVQSEKEARDEEDLKNKNAEVPSVEVLETGETIDVPQGSEQSTGESREKGTDLEMKEVEDDSNVRSTRSGKVRKAVVAEKSAKAIKTAKATEETKTAKATKAKKTAKTSIDSNLTTEVSQETKLMRKAIEDAQTGHNQKQPALVTGCIMKDYQLDGLEWLASLYENGLNGILADEMGLGKTLQCISLFCYLIEHKVDGPFLVVAPLSTVRNWGSEFHRFAPDVSVIQYVGTKDERKTIRMNAQMKKTVVITSYEVIIRDFQRFSRISWGYLTVDEGHRLKNFQSILIQFLKKLKTANRLLLTGTPLQNNLKELWSLLNFILPDIFHDIDLFESWFNLDEITTSETEDLELKKLINEKLQKEIVRSLHIVLKPFLLRRVKRAVMNDLPPKKEYIVFSDLQPLQQILYNASVVGELPERLTELYVKEFLLANETELFSTKEDLEYVDQTIQRFRSDPGPQKKLKRLNYLENDEDEAFNQLIEDEDEEFQNPAAASSSSSSSSSSSVQSDEEYEIIPNKASPSTIFKGTARSRNVKELFLVTKGSIQVSPASTRETSIESVTPQKNRKRTRSTQIDKFTDKFEAVNKPETGIPRVKRQTMAILKAYRMAEKTIRHLALRNRLSSLRNICGSHYSYYYPFSSNGNDGEHDDSEKEHNENKEENNERKFSEFIVQHSGKIQLLEQILDHLLPQDHKVLVFSQFTNTLDLLSLRLKSIGISTSRLDGRFSVDERRDEIEQFSSEGENSSKVFLISTRAGGLGLNLVEADTVILFDSDWNPQMDLQAIDRVHRIGQTKPVKIFRFVVRNTIEEIIIMKSFGKRALEQLVIQLGNFRSSQVARKLAEENIDLSSLDATKSLFSLGQKLNMQGLGISAEVPNVNKTLLENLDPKQPMLLAEEMAELMDRSSDCYSRETQEYPNLSSFESLNNLDE